MVDLTFLTAIVLISAAIIITSIITLDIIVIHQYKSNHLISHRYLTTLTITISVLFTSCSIIDLVHVTISYYILPSSEVLLSQIIISTIADLLYFAGNIMFYILILMRIYVPFQVSKYLIYFLSFLIALSAATSIIYCIGMFLWLEVMQFWIPVCIILMTNDFILNTTILIIFTVKMRKVIAKTHSSSINNEENVALISDTMIKHSLLFGIAIIINQGFFAYNVYLVISLAYTHLSIRFYATYMIRAAENGVIVLILWLVLKVNYNKYLCLCECCHKTIRQCCFKDMGNKEQVEVLLLKDSLKKNSGFKSEPNSEEAMNSRNTITSVFGQGDDHNIIMTDGGTID